MKKFMIGMVILVLLFVGISWACEDESEQIREAERWLNKADRTHMVHYANVRYNTGQSIYLRLIYQEEKKQTKLMKQILIKLNKGVESR
jgi:hypothetical protein